MIVCEGVLEGVVVEEGVFVRVDVAVAVSVTLLEADSLAMGVGVRPELAV